MRAEKLGLGLFIVVCALAGCRATPPTDASGSRPHYAGVGVYTPGASWAQQKVVPQKDADLARLVDDDAVIVVIDSDSGVVRACGDLSGHCVGIDPWHDQAAVLPAPLNRHADETNGVATAVEPAHADQAAR